MRVLRQAGWLLALASLTLASAAAQASTISCTSDEPDTLCSATQTVIGEDFSIFSFQVTEEGFFNLNLFDYAFPTQPLADLSLLLTTGSRTVGSLGSEGVLSFFAAPGKYFIQVYAGTGPESSVGLYGIDVVVNPVPLPSAILLLGSALLFFVWSSSRRRRRDEGELPAGLAVGAA